MWLINGLGIIDLILGTRMVWIGGFVGSGKTVLATLLAALLYHERYVERVYSNIQLNGQCSTTERVPDGSIYKSHYLTNPDGSPREYKAGEMYPAEDAAIVLDEAALFTSNWQDAQPYVMGLRKTNLVLLMPSVWPPVARVKMFEVRRTWSLYPAGIPVWIFGYNITGGTMFNDRGWFGVWKPHRIFGVANTHGFPTDDGGIVDLLEYTLEIDKLRKGRNERKAKRALATFDFGENKIQSPDFNIADVLRTVQQFSSENDDHELDLEAVNERNYHNTIRANTAKFKRN